MQITDHIYKFSFFPNNIVQGISTRYFGVLKKGKRVHTNNLKKFLKELNIPYTQTVLAGLVHGKDIALVNDTTHNRIEHTDGLITTRKNIFLWIGTADCLPVVFYDNEQKIVGIAHAGYKGILAGIIEEMINKFITLGSKKKNLQVGIGPGIGVCCYNVPEERIKMFEGRFPGVKVFEKRNGEYYLDLLKLVEHILTDEGIEKKNMESAGMCTKDHQHLFYSHRGSGRKLHDDFVTIIGQI